MNQARTLARYRVRERPAIWLPSAMVIVVSALIWSLTDDPAKSFSGVSLGMSPAEVRQRLGSPTFVTTGLRTQGPAARDLYVEDSREKSDFGPIPKRSSDRDFAEWIYGDGPHTRSIRFRGSVVREIECYDFSHDRIDCPDLAGIHVDETAAGVLKRFGTPDAIERAWGYVTYKYRGSGITLTLESGRVRSLAIEALG